MSQTIVVSSSEHDNVVNIKVTWTGGQPAVITTPFSASPKLACDACGREYEPGEGGWILVYRDGVEKSYSLCPECLKEIWGMVSVLIKALRGGEK